MKWLVGLSLGMFVAGLVAVPFVVARLPADYFVRAPHSPRHPIRAAFRNVAGGILVLAGVAMSVPLIPGQGILTILVGLSLMDFPRKRDLMLWIARRGAVRDAIAWIRQRARRPPLELPDP